MFEGIPHYPSLLHLCTFISLPINLFAIHCILRHSSNMMKKYKWYLLNMQIWIFLTDLILFALIAPRFYFPLIAGTMHGLFYHLGVPYSIQTIVGFGTGVGMISACTHAIQFRHSQIVPPSSLLARRPRLRTLLNVIRYLLFCQVSVPAALTAPIDQYDAKMRVVREYPFYPSNFFDPSVFLLQEDQPSVVIPGAVVMLFAVLELTFYIFDSLRQLNKPISHMSQRTKKLQKKYLLCVCIQVIIPFTFCLVPIAFLCFTVQFDFFQSQYWNDIAVLTFGLHGVFATLIMLSLYYPYREHCKRLLCSFRARPKSIVHCRELSEMSHVSSCRHNNNR